jgi:hypothetical protein
MPSAIRLPASLVGTYQNLFPTLEFGKVHFCLGLPWFVPKGKGGFTLPDALSASEVTIYLRPDCYDPNSTETFLLIAHELVHAQQIPDMGFGVGLAHPFIASYLGCALANGDFSGSRKNPYEAEAYAYANGPHARLRQFPGAVKGAADTGIAPCLIKTAGAIGSATASMIGALGGGLTGWLAAGPIGAAFCPQNAVWRGRMTAFCLQNAVWRGRARGLGRLMVAVRLAEAREGSAGTRFTRPARQ